MNGRWLNAAPQWEALHGSYDDLVALADEWPTTTETPDAIAEMLATTRRLFAHTWFAYDFGLPAIAWSLISVEASLRYRLGRTDPSERSNFGALLEEAISAGFIKAEWAEPLDAARQLRNRLTHGRMHGVVTPGILDEVISASHAAVAELFQPDA